IISFGEYCDQGVIEHSNQMYNDILSVYPNIKKEIKQSNTIPEENSALTEEVWETDSDISMDDD
ncbi:hypothetical protein AYI68_g2204, partial [Smittium mucronatum]